jgi:hypothetical protein
MNPFTIATSLFDLTLMAVMPQAGLRTSRRNAFQAMERDTATARARAEATTALAASALAYAAAPGLQPVAG